MYALLDTYRAFWDALHQAEIAVIFFQARIIAKPDPDNIFVVVGAKWIGDIHHNEDLICNIQNAYSVK